jgi:FHA domain
MLQIVLLAGKFIFLIILYLFLYRVIRSTTRELRAASPAPARQTPHGLVQPVPVARPGTAPQADVATLGIWHLVVEQSPVLPPGEAYAFAAGAPALVGRSADVDLQLEDTFVSSKHAQFEATPSGLVVEDLVSTNGTQVNGSDISSPTLLSPGDHVEVGDTIFRVEVR